MPNPGKWPVLVDTNAILEAHRCHCWNALAGGLQLETVEMCVAEAFTGHQRRKNQLLIDSVRLRQSFASIHQVPKLDLAKMSLMEGPALDEGERALWAHALQRQDLWVLCGPDAASMRFGYMHGFRDRMLSLEDLLRSVGIRTPAELRRHYRTAWLRDLFSTLAAQQL